MMAGFTELAHRRRMGELGELLRVISTGTQGSQRSVQRLAKLLMEQGA